MAEVDKRQSVVGKITFSPRSPIRTVASDEIKQLLTAHRRYIETGRREGRRANLGGADLSSMDFSGFNLRRAKMDRAVLKGVDFTRAHLQRANLVGAVLEQARLDRADLTGARLSGANLVSPSCASLAALPLRR
jgi:uncharacterized protein YjbI with pentapeptide repeats